MSPSVYNVHVGSGWRHPHKEINKALEAAADAGFDVAEIKSGHVWGHVLAPNGQELTVWSTPRNPGDDGETRPGVRSTEPQVGVTP